MPIQVVSKLKAMPNPTSLPKRIEFQQTLRSLLPQEDIKVTYELDGAHNVYFKDGDAAPAKTFTRAETVGQTDQVCVDRVSLVQGSGVPMDLVTVNQTIVDSVKMTVTDLVVVQIQR